MSYALNWFHHLKINLIIMAIVFFGIIHSILMFEEVRSIDDHVFNYSQKISFELEKNIRTLDMFAIRKALVLIKDERIELIQMSSPYLINSNLQPLVVGNFTDLNFLKLSKSKTLMYNGSSLGELVYFVNLAKLSELVLDKNFGLYVFVVVIFLLILFYSNFVFINFIERTVGKFKNIASLYQSSKSLDSIDFLDLKIAKNSYKNVPTNLVNSYNELVVVITDLLEIQKKYSTAKVASEVAKQVSHDIRSPLSALNMIIGSLKSIPEEQRIMLRSATNRINDIANELLESGKQKTGANSNLSAADSSADLKKSSTKIRTVQLLSPLIDSIVSEKRIQFRDKQGVDIEADLNQGYGLFADINTTELKRTISNLITNAVEALPNNTGRVIVSVKKSDESEVTIAITDNGKGIPAHILQKLGEMGVSFGKEGTQSGSGLGVYHAKKTVEDSGGRFIISSKEGAGTTIAMVFKKSIAPKWFVEKLELVPGMLITSLDDDISIHQIWKGRFESKNIYTYGIEHRTFTAGIEFKDLVSTQNAGGLDDSNKKSDQLYLVDYELLNQNSTGLDIIEELGIGAKSILVTSRYEEDKIRERCEKLGCRLIPKAMAGFVPIEITKPKELYDGILLDDDSLVNRPKITQNSSPAITTEVKTRYDLCLLDDDRALVQTIWAMVAKTKGHNIKIFSTPEEFQSAADSIDRDTPIFIDVSLGNGVSGVDFAEVVHKMGFLNINLATGYSADSIKAPSFIGRIIGKDYPEII